MLSAVTFPPPTYDGVTAWGIGGLAIGVTVAWVVLWSRARAIHGAALATGALGVLLLSALAARSGLLRQFDRVPPPAALLIVSVFALAAAIGLSRWGASAAVDLPFTTLIGLQAFRLPLELVMHRAAALGIMPNELSYSGYNFDIVTGAGALLLWSLLRLDIRVPRWGLWLWNLWGIACLAVIAVIAVTTSPMMRLFGDDPRHVNSWVLSFPYVWLPVALVTIAMASHAVVTRRLLLSR